MLSDILKEIFYIYNESAIYIIFGFLIASILKMLVSEENISKHLGKSDFWSVLRSSLFGIPLPLCSCAVLPTAMSLRRQGASKGATISFLISTPETGVDSISITYALIDPIMTIFRPFSALITAVTAGITANLIEDKTTTSVDVISESAGCSDDGCACEHGGSDADQGGMIKRLFHYAFVELLNDIAFWLVIGIIIAGVISAIVPENFFENYIGSGLLSMIVMLLVGIPIYMCAASSTPIAAALIIKGLSPGAALVFLLAGPATNVGTIAAIGKYLGNRMMLAYLGSIIVVSIALGILLNIIYSSLNIVPAAVVGQASELVPYSLKIAGSLFLSVMIIRNIWVAGPGDIGRALHEKLSDFTGIKQK